MSARIYDLGRYRNAVGRVEKATARLLAIRATGGNPWMRRQTCGACGEKGHTKRQCRDREALARAAERTMRADARRLADLEDLFRASGEPIPEVELTPSQVKDMALQVAEALNSQGAS